MVGVWPHDRNIRIFDNSAKTHGGSSLAPPKSRDDGVCEPVHRELEELADVAEHELDEVGFVHLVGETQRFLHARQDWKHFLRSVVPRLTVVEEQVQVF